MQKLENVQKFLKFSLIFLNSPTRLFAVAVAHQKMDVRQSARAQQNFHPIHQTAAGHCNALMN